MPPFLKANAKSLILIIEAPSQILGRYYPSLAKFRVTDRLWPPM